MHNLSFLETSFTKLSSNVVIRSGTNRFLYRDLESQLLLHIENYKKIGVKSGDRFALVGDYSFDIVAKLLALISLNCILVPLTPDAYSKLSREIKQIIGFDWTDIVNKDVTKSDFADVPIHEYFQKINNDEKPGLVLLTSGTTGTPKVVVHDLSKLLKKFEIKRTTLRTLNFLLFDHWGGLNTLLYTLSNAAELIFPDGRSSENICKKIQDFKVELLPATPSFLSSLLITKMHKKYDLSSLKLITYGAETMPETTLARLHDTFPNVEIRQTYGMIELGVLRSKSKANGSRWVKIGGEGYDVRVREGMLEIKAASAMIGYLNAPSPYTVDGYFMTGDAVIEHGEWLEILGRASDIINVGGNKVYPIEVESEILKLEFVKDCAVFAEDNRMLGKIVCANVVIDTTHNGKDVTNKIIKHCSDNLQKFMVPMKIFYHNDIQSTRLKRLRRDIEKG